VTKESMVPFLRQIFKGKKRKASCGIVGVSRKKVSPPSYEI